MDDHMNVKKIIIDGQLVELSDGIGQSMTGKTVKPTHDTSVSAGEGAEIFNDYRERTFNINHDATTGNIASGAYSHAEGVSTTASGYYSHAEGLQTFASGDYSHAEGQLTKASGANSHAEGYKCEASGSTSHSEGSGTTASGNYSHAEGRSSVASGDHAHAEGYNCKATGKWSHSKGYASTASGCISFASGYTTIAHSREFVIGIFNVDSGGTDSDSIDSKTSLFIIGNSNNSTSRSNIFRVTQSKIMGSTSFSSSGADYAEMFEWEDGNPNNEDRCGRFVTIRNDKISLASSIDQFILGIVSGNPTMIGDSHEDQWCSMYETDIFGRPIYEEVDVPARIDDEGNIITPEHKEMQRKVNPDYNNMEKYIGRQDRPEWDAVGLMGKLVMIDDETCQPDQFCKPSESGIATYSDEKTKYYVLKRLDENHIKVLIL